MLAEMSLLRQHEPYRVSVDEYRAFRRDGYLIVRGLVEADEVADLAHYTEELMAGERSLPGVAPPPADATDAERRLHYERIHMPHRTEAIAERFMLHPRIVDVLEALHGPDILALQTMLFFKQPGQAGQGFHQDSYYIPTQPDTLIGAWMAIDRATEDNGCLWITPGSQHEPIYPDCDGVTQQGDTILDNIESIMNASHPDIEKNTLAPIALRYADEVAVPAEPGDVIFFGGHVLHRSHRNGSNRQRRAFVSHYCNARSRVVWNHRTSFEGEDDGASANHLHILARGSTHLPYAQPKFGTLCAANAPELYGHRVDDNRVKSMMGDDNGFMVVVPHEAVEHDH